jgi:hypothetical protein
MTELGASMPQFSNLGNNLKHYFCYIVSNLRWKYSPSFVNVTFLVIYSYNRCIHAVPAHPVVADWGQDGRKKTAKVVVRKALV